MAVHVERPDRPRELFPGRDWDWTFRVFVERQFGAYVDHRCRSRQWTPFVILLLYSGLQALPKDPYEAAELDGATGFQKFWHITLPAMRNTMLICVLIRGMDAFREYDKVYTMTYGGPGSSTESASFYIYRQGFVFFNTGFSTALSLIMLVLTIIVVQTSVVKLRST